MYVGFDMDQFWWLDLLNSQVAEQGNSSLKNIKTQAAFMTIPHFYLYLRFFCAMHNDKILSSTIEQLRSSNSKKQQLKHIHAAIKLVKKLLNCSEEEEAPCQCDFCKLISADA